MNMRKAGICSKRAAKINEKNTIPKRILKSPLKPKILSPLKRKVYIDMINILPEKMKPLYYQQSVLRASGRASLGRNLCGNGCRKCLGWRDFFNREVSKKKKL